MPSHIDPIVVYARSFIEAFGADCGTRLRAVAAEIGLTIEDAAANTFDGALIRVAGKPLGTVLLNSDIREEGRRLFTLAHEIGHYVLPAHSKKPAVCQTSEVQSWSPTLPVDEIEANRFAAEILMPQGSMTGQLRKEPSFHVVRRIAEQFQTSLTASTYRLVELSSYRIAMVWSTAGRRVWYKASEEFGRAVELGPLSTETFAADCFRREPTPDHPESVPAIAWFYDCNLMEGARIWEQSVLIPNYESVLSLLYIREPVEPAEEPPDEEADLDPTEFTLARRRWPRK